MTVSNDAVMCGVLTPPTGTSGHKDDTLLSHVSCTPVTKSHDSPDTMAGRDLINTNHLKSSRAHCAEGESVCAAYL